MDSVVVAVFDVFLKSRGRVNVAWLYSATARVISWEASMVSQWSTLEFRGARSAQMAIHWNDAQHVVDTLACSETREHLGIFSGALWRQPPCGGVSIAWHIGCG